MYVIKADDYVVHDGFIQNADFVAVSGTFTEEFNRAGTLSFTVPPNNSAYRRGYLKKLITVITVYDKRKRLVWKGRIIDTSRDFYNNVTFNCEGWMGVLNDSIIRPNGTGSSGGGGGEGGGGGIPTSSVISRAVNWAVGIADDNSHGYDQGSRWGPDYDCSSLVISAWEYAGVPVKTNGATYTGDMYPIFTNLGFVDVTATWTPETAQAGDILLNHVKHTAMIRGFLDGTLYIVEASGNERGGATGGATGDQTGREIAVKTYAESSFGRGSTAINAVLRYPGGQATPEPTPEPEPEPTPEQTGPVGTVATYNLTDEQIHGLANVFVSEEGEGEAAIRAVASHLLNRFERYPIGGLNDPYNYLIYAGWWGSASFNQGRIGGSHGTASATVDGYVSDVIRNGKRNIPLFIDEYDMFPGDVAYATNNGATITKGDRSQYVKDVTVVHNVYGSTYTFYGFYGEDIFGYINKRPGDVDFIPAEAGGGNTWSGETVYDIVTIDPASYFVWLIQNHNDQVGAEKALNVIIPPNVFTEPLDFPAANYDSTLDYIQTNFLNNEEVGGRMWVEDNTIYFYPDGAEDVSTQAVVFGRNLLDLTESYDASEVFTAIIPTGGEVELEDGSKQTLKLDFGDGVDYIVSAEGAEKYGIIMRHVDFSDVVSPDVLIAKAIECLEKNVESTMSIEVSAFDMGLVDNTVGDIRVGTFVEVRSDPHDLKQAYICTAAEIDITNPANSKYTLGVNADTLTTRQMKLTRNISNITGQTVENPTFNIFYEPYLNNVTIQYVLLKRSGHSVNLQFRVKSRINIPANHGQVPFIVYDSRFVPSENLRFDTGHNETKNKHMPVFVSKDGTKKTIGIRVIDAVSIDDIITGTASWTYSDD